MQKWYIWRQAVLESYWNYYSMFNIRTKSRNRLRGQQIEKYRTSKEKTDIGKRGTRKSDACLSKVGRRKSQMESAWRIPGNFARNKLEKSFAENAHVNKPNVNILMRVKQRGKRQNLCIQYAFWPRASWINHYNQCNVCIYIIYVCVLK